MFRFGSPLVIAVAVLFCLHVRPMEARAEAMTLSGFSLVQRVTVGGTNLLNEHGTVWAGELRWQWAGVPPQQFAQVFFAYCVDLAKDVKSPQKVSIQTSDGFTNGVTLGGAKAAWLFNEYAAGIHDARDTVGAAALQVAIWEAMYDTAPDLTTGGFDAVGTNSSITNRANQYLSSLYSSTWNAVAIILNADTKTGGGQDQITQVSEPSTLLFLGLAFFGIATLTGRFRRTA